MSAHPGGYRVSPASREMDQRVVAGASIAVAVTTRGLDWKSALIAQMLHEMEYFNLSPQDVLDRWRNGTARQRRWLRGAERTGELAAFMKRHQLT